MSRKWEHSWLPNSCGKALTPLNSYHLACKAFQDNSLSENEYENKLLNITQFKKDILPQFKKEKDPNVKHTFWGWFHSMMVVTQEYLEPISTEGYVIGFVSKAATEKMLADKPEGTFLIRFSDSTLGGVSIASSVGKLHSSV